MVRIKKGASLQEWISETTTPEMVAISLGITTFGVRSWMRAKGWPAVEQILALIKLSKGALTFESIVESTASEEQKRRIK